MKPINLKSTVLILILLANVYLAKGQGCSDAGFCTLNSFQPNNSHIESEAKNQFKIGVSFGSADKEILAIGNYLEYNRQLGKRFGLDTRITTLAQSGNNISEFGFSDIYFNLNYKLTEKIVLTAGAKIPLTNGNKTRDNISLPMDYQSSLGTVDLLVGIGFEIKKLQIVTALQQPLTQNNNQFMPENYPLNSEIRTFHSTNQFKRAGDVLLRLSYPINILKRFKITPSLLNIYHLTYDRYTDILGMEKNIPNSDGLTINGALYVDFVINQSNSLQINMGKPFIVRESRPDGLTRSFVLNLEYKIKF